MKIFFKFSLEALLAISLAGCGGGGGGSSGGGIGGTGGSGGGGTPSNCNTNPTRSGNITEVKIKNLMSVFPEPNLSIADMISDEMDLGHSMSSDEAIAFNNALFACSEDFVFAGNEYDIYTDRNWTYWTKNVSGFDGIFLAVAVGMGTEYGSTVDFAMFKNRTISTPLQYSDFDDIFTPLSLNVDYGYRMIDYNLSANMKDHFEAYYQKLQDNGSFDCRSDNLSHWGCSIENASGTTLRRWYATMNSTVNYEYWREGKE